MDEALFGGGLRRRAAGQPGAEVAAPGDDGQQIAEHAMQRAALGVSGDEFAQAVEVGGDVGEQVGEAGEVGIVGRGGAGGNGGVSHEWLQSTGLEPAVLPAKRGVADRAGWQTGTGPAGVAPSRTARHRRSHARSSRRIDVKKPREARLGLRQFNRAAKPVLAVCASGANATPTPVEAAEQFAFCYV